MSTITFSINSTVLTASKTYTATDSDMQALLNWAAMRYANVLPGNPTNSQIALAMVQDIVNTWKINVQNFSTQPATVPPPMGWV